MIKQKHVLICNAKIGESIAQSMNQRYSIPFHLSNKKVFLSSFTMAMRKSLPQLITNQINRM